MKLCFDATRFGFGLDEAIRFAAEKGVAAVEFAFDPFEVTAKNAKLSADEKEYLSGVKELCDKNETSVACLRLNYVLDCDDKKAVKNFQLMMKKLGALAKAVGCDRVSFAIKPSDAENRIEIASAAINPVLADFDKQEVKLLLSLSTPEANRHASLREWRPLEPQEWRDLIANCEGLALSFSAADCAWQNINYLQILPGLVKAIEHVEANDVEINRELLQDSGLFGPLWWRYRKPGKGSIDWRQLIEALKMYDYNGSLSIRFDDEFLDTSNGALEETLEESVRFFTPLLKY
jgi:sugar phosphate isomerase/epimerase